MGLEWIGELIGGIFGSNAASDASDAMADAYREGIDLQRDIFNRQDELGANLLKRQGRDVRGVRREGRELAGAEREDLGETARDLYNTGVRGARKTYDRNKFAINRSAREGRKGLGRDRWMNLRDIREGGANARGELRPYAHQGKNAMLAYASNLGLGDGPRGYEGLSMTPGAQFLLNEGRDTIEGGAAGGGGLYSGNTMADLEEFRQGIAATDRDNQMAQLFALAGRGQEAAGDIADIWQNTAAAKAGQRNYSTGQLNDLLKAYTVMGNVNRNDFRDTRYGVQGDFANRTDAATTGYTDNMLNLGQNFATNMGNARNARQTAFGGAAQNFGNAAQFGLQGMGEALAAGTIGQTNAWTNALNNIFTNIGQNPPSWMPDWMSGGTGGPMPRPA